MAAQPNDSQSIGVSTRLDDAIAGVVHAACRWRHGYVRDRVPLVTIKAIERELVNAVDAYEDTR